MKVCSIARKRYLRQTSHYRVTRQLAVMQRSGLQLGLPTGSEDLHGNAQDVDM